MEVDAFSRDAVVLIPTGSLEQHGPALPMFTDSLIVTAVAEAVEQAIPTQTLLTPTLWLGASGHHLGFCGTLSAGFDSYTDSIVNVVESLVPHGFQKFYLVNGHGGNKEPNGTAMRGLKARYVELTFGHASYYDFARTAIAECLEGPLKEMRHACEAESSLIMHLRPDLVRKENLRTDGLTTVPPVIGVIHHFDEATEQGSYGFAPLATPAKGRIIFDAAIHGLTTEIATIANGYFLRGL